MGFEIIVGVALGIVGAVGTFVGLHSVLPQHAQLENVNWLKSVGVGSADILPH